MTTTIVKGITWDEYLNLPYTHYEVIDGEVKELPSPGGEHQLTVGKLYFRLFRLLEAKGLGVLLLAPFDVVISRNPLRTRQPDLLFLSTERGGSLANVRRLQRLETAPDLVIEILSPNETTQQWLSKLRDYAQLGVREMWLVDPDSRTIEVIVIENGQWRSGVVFTGNEALQSLVLPDIELLPVDIFED